MEAIILRKKAGAIHYWKKYDVNSVTAYTWNRWNLVSTTIYKWEKWNVVTTYTWNKYNSQKGPIISSSGPGSVTYRYGSNGYYETPYARAITNPSSFNPNNTMEYYDRYYMDFRNCNTTMYNVSLNSSVSISSSDAANKWYFINIVNNNAGNDLGATDRVIGNAYRATSGRDSGTADTQWYYWVTVYGTHLWSISTGDIKGNYSYGTVSSTSSSAYPYGGKASDGYWYDYNGSSTSKGSTSYGQVTSTNSSAYPSNGASGSYWYESAGSEIQYSKGSTQQPDVTSTDSNAYPENGHDGSYWYDNRTSNTTHSMGSYIEDIFSTNPDKYPANGISGSFWYVYQGQL